MFAGLPRPLLFAHRGASAKAPENTLPAFELGARLGADILELDVHGSRDGHVMVMHDATLERTTDGHGRLCDHSLAELRALDAGFRFDAPRHPFRGRGVQVPLLEEVLRAFPRMGFNIEIKQREPPLVHAVLDILAKVGPRAVLLAAGNDAVMQQLEAAKPGCALGLSAGQVKRLLKAAYLGEIPSQWRGRALQIPPRQGLLPVATRRVLRRAQAAGLEVHLWTINSPWRAARWLARGVDGVMSDDPGALADLIVQAQSGAALAP